MFHQLLKLVQKERGDQGETRPRQKKAGLLSWFIRKASSENFISNHEKRIKKLEELKLEIQKCKIERDELSQILDLYVNDGLNYRLSVELPMLKSQHEMRTMDMHKITKWISDAMEKYKELMQENNSYRIRNFHLLNERNELKKNVRILMNENRKLLVEQTELQASCEEGKRFCEEASKTIYTADIESLCPVTFE
uniref:Spetex-2C protein n=1 Tax=Rattus norvegicus TaxID=10116 RepID=F1LXX8_RAT